MSDQRINAGLPGILKKLGVMTAIRDTYMVEQSLLRTLGPILGVLETSFYRTDSQGNIIRALYYSRKEEEKEGVKRIVENIEEVTNEQDISITVRNLLDSARLLRKSCSRKLETDLITSYPIYGNNELLGCFVFIRDREVTPFEDAIIHGILEVFTNYFDLLDESQRDPLTGLLNRYSLESNLDRLWNLLSTRVNNSERADKNQDNFQSIWLAVLDVDHFKKINDNYGHTIGDEVLIMLTRLLQESLRQSDLLYRYGGEEFVLIITTNNFEDATKIFERIRMKIEQFDFPQVGNVTISGGFCQADPMILPKEVINRADSSLYAAKEAGRNRIFFYDTLVKEGSLKVISTGSIDLF
ncbi:MAG: GGDEF domain-containing protein [Methylococcales bacterium]|nr:GGDEF domain-containing protein [Methylococcales bacterium]